MTAPPHRFLSPGKDVFVQDCWCRADPEFRIPVRIITQYAWHSLFVRNMFIQATPEELPRHVPGSSSLTALGSRFPGFDQTRSDVFIIINFAKNLVLIGGTEYAGKSRSRFSTMNYFLPPKMSCPCTVRQTQPKWGCSHLLRLSGQENDACPPMHPGPSSAMTTRVEPQWNLQL
jgi:ATP-dependent phosphoenolpyruvate carboxykinase